MCEICRKSGRHCQGYRDQLDLKFRNSTQDTEQQASHRQQRRRPPPVSQQTSWTLPVDSERLALNYFLANFGETDSSPSSIYGGLQILPDLYSKTSSTSALWSATSAAALALFTLHELRDPSQMSKAHRRYGEALKRLYSSCREPAAARADETLCTILLMGSIEVRARLYIGYDSLGQSQRLPCLVTHSCTLLPLTPKDFQSSLHTSKAL